MTSPNLGPWWVPASRNGKANFITRSNAILLAFVAGLVGAIFGASSSGSLFGHSINLSRVTNSVERAPGSVADIAQRVIPSVVSIEATSKDGGSTGTGFVIESNGYILTNNHVIAEAVSTNGSIDVTLNSGQKYTAKVVGRDSSYDLAVLKIATTGLTALQLGDSDKVAVGDSVIAIGSPLGLSGTVTLGIISAKNRAVTAGETGSDNSFINALQTDAAINPGTVSYTHLRAHETG
jgi:putative serine protease PepD